MIISINFSDQKYIQENVMINRRILEEAVEIRLQEKHFLCVSYLSWKMQTGAIGSSLQAIFSETS